MTGGASGGDGATVMARWWASAARTNVTGGAQFRAVVDVGNWDASLAINAPGQSGDPRSPHYADLQARWLAGLFGTPPVCPSHWLPTTQAFLDASLSGLGWGMNPTALAAEHVAAGRLVELVPGAVFEVPLFWQVNRLGFDHILPLTNAVMAAANASLAAG